MAILTPESALPASDISAKDAEIMKREIDRRSQVITDPTAELMILGNESLPLSELQGIGHLAAGRVIDPYMVQAMTERAELVQRKSNKK